MGCCSNKEIKDCCKNSNSEEVESKKASWGVWAVAILLIGIIVIGLII